MVLTKTVHPQACANRLIMIYSPSALSALWKPVFTGLLSLAVVAVLWSRLFPERQLRLRTAQLDSIYAKRSVTCRRHSETWEESRMNWKGSITVGISVAFLGSGCGLQPQLVRVAPPVTSKAAENDRGGASVGVAAFDVRPDQKLGIITDAHDRKVDVATTGDVAAALYDCVTQALTRSGFRTKPAGSDDSTSLRVELQGLSFNALKQPFDFDVALKVSVSAQARNGLDSYDRTFTVNQRKAAGAPPSKAETTLMVNEALGVALSDMLADQELMNFLAR